MLNYLIILATINVVIVFITDLTDWPDTVKKALSWLTTHGRISSSSWEFHLIDCSLCLIFHASWIFTLVYCLVNSMFSPLMLMFICLNAFLATTVKDILLFAKDFIAKINRVLYKILKLND